jgi:hypothetical protein
MAIVQQQINPLDLTPSIGVGISLPFNSPRVFSTNYTTKDQISSNLINLVLTEKEEIVFKPGFGVGLKSLLFEQNINSEELKQRIQNEIIKDNLLRNITISNVNIDQDINTNTINVSIEYNSNLNGTSNLIQIGIGGSNLTSIKNSGPSSFETKQNNY